MLQVCTLARSPSPGVPESNLGAGFPDAFAPLTEPRRPSGFAMDLGVTIGASAFEWPPPQPSARMLIPSAYLPKPGSNVQLSAVADRLQKALSARGYQEHSWFEVPGGFVLVTRLEQITAQGVPAPSPNRWSAEPMHRVMSLRDYVNAMFTAPQGRFRVIALLVTDQPLTSSGVPPKQEDAVGWLSQGSLNPPRSVSTATWTLQHVCAAYIYEFEKPSTDRKATFVASSQLSGEAHLRGAGLIDALRGML